MESPSFGHLLVESSSWVMLQGCGATRITLRAGTWEHHGVCDLHEIFKSSGMGFVGVAELSPACASSRAGFFSGFWLAVHGLHAENERSFPLSFR